LEGAVSKINLEVKENIELLKNLGADNALMTGSGSAVYGIFNDKKLLKKAYENLKPKFKDNIKIIKTL
jgi:4-diphosphocytidyl-2-C-methyl-D-erythritol kinase